MEEDDMGSLFEGMELFSPSQLQSDSPPSTNTNPPPPPPIPQIDTTENDEDDENLFSDLNLQQPLSLDSPTDSPQLTSTSPKSPQIPITADVDKDEEEEEARGSNNTSTSSSYSILSQFDRIKSQISKKLSFTRELAASLSDLRKEAISSRRKAASDLQLASTKHRELELQLEEACAAEDFESADKISEEIAVAESERQMLLVAVRDAEARCDAVDVRLLEFLDRQIEAELECCDILSRFAKDAVGNADLVSKETEEVSSKEMENWFLTSEELEGKKIELDIVSLFINEASLVVDDSIELLIENDKKEKEDLCKKKDVLNAELEELLRLVREKEKEIVENNVRIMEVEERITGTVSGFEEVQSSIGAKQDRLQLILTQINKDNEALLAKRMEIDKFIAEQEEHKAKLREVARVSKEEAKEYQEVVELRKSLKSSILKSKEDKERLAKAEAKLIEDVQVLQQQASTARASLQELSSRKSRIQQNISSSKQKTFYIDKRIPELEAEKRVAATARNFKEAARIASESKSLTLEKENVSIDLEKATSDFEKLEEEIKNTVTSLEEIEGLILSKEKEVAMVRYQTSLMVAGAATVERNACLEINDIEEANLLSLEAEAALAEAKKIEDIYNFKEEDFQNLPKQFISIGIVSRLGQKQLAELAGSADFSEL